MMQRQLLKECYFKADCRKSSKDLRRLSYACCLLLFFLFFIAAQADAAYVGNPSRIFDSKDKDGLYSIFTEGITDIVYDRGAKFQADDMKVYFHGAMAGLIYKNRYAVYGAVGATEVEEAYIIEGKNIKWETGYGFTWTGGGTLKVYEKDFKNFYNSRLLLSLDIQFRNTGVRLDTVTIDSAEFAVPHPDIDYSAIEYNDWHLTLACALDMGMFSPYAGFKYSDFESCARVMNNGILYQKDNAEADNNFGFFVGASFSVIDSLYAGIEAGFVDENSLSGSLSFRF